MDKIEGMNEVLYQLKDRQLLTSGRKDIFVWKKERVYRYFGGSCIVMNLEDFIDLYGEESFYLYEDNSSSIDDEKDEAYYRYYRK